MESDRTIAKHTEKIRFFIRNHDGKLSGLLVILTYCLQQMNNNGVIVILRGTAF